MVARMSGNESVTDSAAHDHTKWLKDGQCRQQPTPVPWKTFQCDRCVDGNVSTNSKASECCKGENGPIRVWDTETDSKYTGHQDCEIE